LAEGSDFGAEAPEVRAAIDIAAEAQPVTPLQRQRLSIATG